MSTDSQPALWADFTGAYFTGRLRDAGSTSRPEPVGSPGTIKGGIGSMYIQLEATDGEIMLEAGEETLVRDGEWVPFSGDATIPDGEGRGPGGNQSRPDTADCGLRGSRRRG